MSQSPEKVSGAGPTLYLIDGHAQIFRAYHAIRGGLNSPVTGEPTNATFGFVGMLLKLFRDCHPDYVVVAIDASGDQGTFRSQLDPQYKANRDAPPEDLEPQVQRIVEICQLWRIPVLGIEGVEADDTIATLVTRLTADPNLRIRIVSRDKDLQQLLSDRVSLYDIHKDETIDVAALHANLGIAPAQVIDMLALMGDNVDNIPGVHGVGPKTAAKLISQYGSLNNLLAHTDDLSGKLKENIEAARDRLPLNIELVTLKHDVPVDFSLEDARVGPPPVDVLRPMFKQLGFTRHITELEAACGLASSPPAAPVKTTPQKPAAEILPADNLFAALHNEEHTPSTPKTLAHYDLIATREQLDELVATLKTVQTLSVDTETDQLDPMRAKMVGVCLSWANEQGVYIPVRSANPSEHLDEPTVIAAIKPILEDPAIEKVGQNLKYDMIVLRRAGVRLNMAKSFDTIVASYLIDATRSSHKLDNLALAFLNYTMIPITDLIGSGKHQRSMVDLPASTVCPYGAEDADIALRLRQLFARQIKIMGITELFEKLEMPLVEVLAELEYNGIQCDPDELARQKVTVDERIAELHDQILKTAGVDFNPDSPKQLADVLFNKLGCKVVKRRKTGPSTDSEVLARIADEQPPPGSVVAELILEYRMLTKLRGTYLQSLADAINPQTHRIHASFNQVVAATGRLSSSDPNLQNIPIRTDLGRQIRKAFVAPPGSVLLAADYSQIELRLLAHLSQDRTLISAFENDMDIHKVVAAEVFGVPVEEVTSEQRGVAKMVNFGIVYGITPFGLARRLPAGTAGSSVDVAKKIIHDYKNRYPKINQFLADCVAEAELKGYVETICKRRRPIPEVKSNNPNLAAFGRRIAINTVVQGSAADLIKMAMVNLHQRIEREHRPLKMLVQIHDEVLFQLDGPDAPGHAAMVSEEMSNAMKLIVPLKVQTAWGPTWFDCK
ncbi:MAG: DNA polymerase I [Planctomycetes bacterium]|nr:DNA polymerase I [Planctomycetota bacterium]